MKSKKGTIIDMNIKQVCNYIKFEFTAEADIYRNNSSFRALI